jgi:AcrR family transcriptional regulator
MPRIQADSVAEHKAVIRRRLLDASMTLFSELGYEATTFADLAAEADVGRTTIYEYFSDKEDLLASLVEAELPQTIDEMLSRLPDGSGTDRLVALARAMVEFIALDPTLGLLLHREVPKLNQEARVRVERAHLDLIHEFVSLIRGGVERGELRDLPLDVLGRLVQDIIMSGAKVLIDAKDPHARMDEVTDAVVEVLLHGIAN